MLTTQLRGLVENPGQSRLVDLGLADLRLRRQLQQPLNGPRQRLPKGVGGREDDVV